MKRLRLLDSCTQVSVTRNRYGDLVFKKLYTIKCLFRNISTLSHTNRREEIAIDGIFWFDASTTLKMGDVVQYSATYYRITKVIVARQLLTSGLTHFVKCEVVELRQVS